MSLKDSQGNDINDPKKMANLFDKFFVHVSQKINDEIPRTPKSPLDYLRHNNIHLLDRTETNIIFIWSGKVILGEAKPSPNITSPDQINMILGEVLSNECFIIPATLCAPGPSHIY